MQRHAEDSYLELLGVEDVTCSRILFLARLGRGGGRVDNKDFMLVTVLREGVPKAITDLA